MKDQLEQQQKALQDVKKEQLAVTQAARPAGVVKVQYQRKGKKASNSLSSDTISSLEPIDLSEFVTSESDIQGAKEVSDPA